MYWKYDSTIRDWRLPGLDMLVLQVMSLGSRSGLQMTR
jgi:hypothetical protein